MTLPALLRQYAAYNLWANRRLVEWLQSQAEEVLTQPLISSFPSLRATLQHIWGAQGIWLQRLQGESPNRLPTEGFAGHNADLLAGLLENSETLANFVSSRHDGFFDQTITYTHSSGLTYTQVNSEVLLHCLQHSTFHRGQIVTMARNLGLTDPPPTDYLVFIRQRDA